MNIEEKLIQSEAMCSNLMDAIIFILKDKNPELLNKIINKHIDLCFEWDKNRDEK